MAATLHFSLVSPERELFAGEADRVLVPGAEGLFEVGPSHAPVMSTLSPGMLAITIGGTVTKFFVRGGFADVNTDGLTVLAEVAIPEAELKGDRLSAEKKQAADDLASGQLSADATLNAQRAQDLLSAY